MATVDSRIPSASANSTQGLVSLEQAKLGVLLNEQGLLDPIQLLYARQKNLVEQTSFGRLLIRHGLANESDIVRTHAGMLGIEFAPTQRREKIALHDDALAVAARQSLIGEMIGPRMDGVAYLLPEA